MQIGTRVRFINEVDDMKKSSGFYPPIGTLGTVERVDYRGKEEVLVQWDSGTIGDGRWWCCWTDVEIVEKEE